MLHLKLVNAATTPQPLSIDLTGLTASTTARIYSLRASTYEATDTMQDPNLITPRDSTVSVPTTAWQYTVPALTIQVLDIPLHASGR
jgi:alpha-L-arabinofuranosidase